MSSILERQVWRVGSRRGMREMYLLTEEDVVLLPVLGDGEALAQSSVLVGWR
jgi:hypothetical protein